MTQQVLHTVRLPHCTLNCHATGTSMRTAAFFPLMGQSSESLNFENDQVFSKQKNKLIKLTVNRLPVIASSGEQIFHKKKS
jgi:hypothetical protein